MMPNDLKNIAKSIAPERIVPLHTENPELVGKYLQSIARVEIPAKDGKINL